MDCCSRYEHPEFFQSPPTLWLRKPDETPIESCNWSISGYLLAIIGNLHNSIMSSNSNKWVKLVTVLSLSAASLSVCLFAVWEIIARLILAIITLPLLIPACCIYCPPLAISGGAYFSAIATLTQVPNSLYIAYQLSTHDGNVNPVGSGETIGSVLFPALTCGFIQI